MAESKVQVTIDAKDNASGVIGTVTKNWEGFAIKMAAVAGVALAVGKGLEAVVDAAGDAQVKTAAMDATFNALKDTTLKVVTGQQTLKQETKDSAANIADLKSRASDAAVALKRQEMTLTELHDQLMKGKINQTDYAQRVAEVNVRIKSLSAAMMDGAHAAATYEDKTVDVVKTIKLTGAAVEEARNKIVDASHAFTKLGFDDEEAAKSMALLYQRTGDVTQSIKLGTLAADLARAKQIDLDSATKLVTLALSGQGRALMQYGISIKDAATPLEALGELQKAVGGQAEAFANTYVGQSQVLQQTWGNFLELIGEKLLPVLTQALKALSALVETIPSLVDQVKVFWSALDRATGIGTLFKELWDGVVSTFQQNLMPALRDLWAALQPLMPFFQAMGVVIGATLVGAIILLAEVLSVVAQAFTIVLTVATGVATALITGIGAAIQFVTDKLADLINWVKQAIEWLSKLSLSSVAGSIGNAIGGAVGKVGGLVGSVIPHFDVGGTVPGPVGAPMLAVVHGGEYVIPNSGPRSSGFGGGINISITGNTIASHLDIRELADTVGKEIMRNLKMAQQV